jgi:hypothetical protein
MQTRDFKDLTNNLMFYRGVIEDNNDPDKIGRVRVRIFGIHPDDDEKVPTKTLPWAEVMTSTAMGLNTGIGLSSIANKGTYVWVFFEAQDWNKPVVIGAIYGIPEKQDAKAFSDPDKKFPMSDRLEEPDINRLARGEKISDTAMDKVRKSNTTKGISTSTGVIWNEPEHLSANSKYPDNTVLETKGGTILEFDDTKGNERWQLFHKKGTYMEVRPDGKYVVRVHDEKYEVIAKDSFQNNQMSKFVTTNADYEMKVGGYEERRVAGDHQEKIGGDVKQDWQSKHELKVGSSQKIDVTANSDYSVGGTFNIKGATINLN